MAYGEPELKAKTVKELKELAKELGVPTGGKKDELIGAILAAQQLPAADDEVGALEEPVDELLEPALDGAAAADQPAAGAAPGRHQAIVWKPAENKAVIEKKANIVGVTTLSDKERAQLRAAKFGIADSSSKGTSSSSGKQTKPAAAAAAPAPKTLEEQVKILERGLKYGTASDGDQPKLDRLKKQLEAQHDKQRLALDKVELMDPDKMAAREKKFGKPLLSAKDPRDPEAMKKRAAKFGKPVKPSTNADDEARKKARLERFTKEK